MHQTESLSLSKKVMHISWKGVYPALTTKFNSDFTLDLAGFRNNLLFQLQCGVDGIILGGTLGEASVLTEEEKMTLVTTAKEACDGKVPVVLNIAEGSTAEAISKVKMAAEWGADGLMVLPPMRYKADDEELFQFFSAIAASTSLPMMIYNNPVDYKNLVTLDVFERLLNQHQNIRAVKESTRDVSNVTRLKNRFGDRLSVLCGVDTLAMESFVLGADGWVAGLVCAFPAETVHLFHLCQERKVR
jgi:dihydrodipicolinate synthase/N-acetylneuraminate lyase